MTPGPGFSGWVLYLAITLTPCRGFGQSARPLNPVERLEGFAAHWSESAWRPENRPYMRPLGDPGWALRMETFQALVRAGRAAGPALVRALRTGDDPARILAAQTLGYLPGYDASKALREALRDPDPAVRLYAVDALGMIGVPDLEALLERHRAQGERNRDVRKHIHYALERGAHRVKREVIRDLVRWDNQTLDSARVGELAPDFELATVTGKRLRLSDYRGKKKVVLVFIYGDT